MDLHVDIVNNFDTLQCNTGNQDQVVHVVEKCLDRDNERV